MSLYLQLKEDLKDAMRAKEETRLTTIRSVISALTNELVAQKKRPTDAPDDDMVMTVLTRLAKQRKEAADQFRAGGRPELAENEDTERTILETYLPAQLSYDEIVATVEAKKSALGIVDKTDMNKLMGAVMFELKGRAGGADVRKAIEESFV
ncbi:MAG: GatB/YqeY domain-containing protein [Candidatus Yonathbacteria bacterium]|nr:GatB/YqeY domain-containing protein [Candidatus Yonathbacteria bacterium]NTW47840.1 GatB/YqeY domain-containing protein [Candidatus Yonathbacteria bacterium]